MIAKTLIRISRDWILRPTILLIRSLFTLKKLVIFFGRSGRSFEDNSKFLFLHAVEHSAPDVSVRFFIRSRTKYKSMRKKFGERIVYSYSFRALVLFARCPVIIINHGLNDCFPFVFNNQRWKVINLFHAIPLKRIGHMVPGANAKVLERTTQEYSFFIASSEEEKKELARDLRMPEKKFWVTGQPRNDNLVKKELNSLTHLKKELSAKHIILYAPTFRDDGRAVEIFPFHDRNIDELNNTLEQLNAHILLRHHVNEFERLATDSEEPSNRIHLLNKNLLPDVQDILPHIDILITDYSSVCLDFLLMNRPMIFLPYDYEEYLDERGFTFDYHEATAGVKVSTQVEFLKWIKAYIDQPDLHSELRVEQKERFHKYTDGQNSARIWKRAESLLQN